MPVLPFRFVPPISGCVDRLIAVSLRLVRVMYRGHWLAWMPAQTGS